MRSANPFDPPHPGYGPVCYNRDTQIVMIIQPRTYRTLFYMLVHAYVQFRLQLYSILKSDWSGAWLLLPIVTRTVNSIVSAGYSRKIVIMCVKWNLFSKSHSF